MTITETTIKNVLTVTSGYLDGIATHSLNPYQGCSFGNSLCGVGCYVRHNNWLTKGRAWGSFLEVRANAAESYLANVKTARLQAAGRKQQFGIFMSSSTDPFVPQELKSGVTLAVLKAMVKRPPDELIIQTHNSIVASTDYREVLEQLAQRCKLRVQISIESDQQIPGMPGMACSVNVRLHACQTLRNAGIRTVVCVAPLLPLAEPETFFERIELAADAVIIDHFIGGDGSHDGARTRQTPLPAAMEAIHPGSTKLSYQERIVTLARKIMPGRVGVSREGFAGQFA